MVGCGADTVAAGCKYCTWLPDGWISWAWNSVLGEDEENDSDLPLDESTSSQKESILITVGLHLRETQLVFRTGHRPSLPAAKIYLGGTGVELIGKIFRL